MRQIPADNLLSGLSTWDRQWRPTSYGMTRNADGELDADDRIPARSDLTRQYAWAIPSPKTLGFIVKTLDGAGVVEVGAGTGYWAWQLAQAGVDVLAYDVAPPDRMTNWYHSPRHRRWHVYNEADQARIDKLWTPLLEGYQFWENLPEHKSKPAAWTKPERPVLEGGGEWTEVPEEGAFRPVFHPILEGDERVSAEHPDRTLFLCWPPYDSPMGFNAVSAYTGSRLIHIGEGEGGCTGNSDLFALLDAEWRQVGEWDLPQWSGIHDVLTVHERKVPLAITPMRAALALTAHA